MTLDTYIEQLAFHEALSKWAQATPTPEEVFQGLQQQGQEAERPRESREALRGLKRIWNYRLGPQLYRVTEPFLEGTTIQNPFPM